MRIAAELRNGGTASILIEHVLTDGVIPIVHSTNEEKRNNGGIRGPLDVFKTVSISSLIPIGITKRVGILTVIVPGSPTYISQHLFLIPYVNATRLINKEEGFTLVNTDMRTDRLNRLLSSHIIKLASHPRNHEDRILGVNTAALIRS